MEKLTVLGGHGFVGSCFVKNTPNMINDISIKYVNERNDYSVATADVLYFISTTHNYHVFTDTHIDIDTNLKVLVNVLENWRKYQLLSGEKGTFNFVSSWFVYGDGPIPATEEQVCNPKGFYSITKRAAEQLLISYCETFDLNYRILRLANVIGEKDPRASAQKNALQYMINLMKEGEPIELYDRGDFYRDYIHVRDCVRAIGLVLYKGNKNEIYNIGNGIPIKFFDAIDIAHNRTGYKSVIRNIDQKDFHKKVQVKSFYMDNSKLKSLGYKQSYCLDDMIRGMI